MAQQEAKEALYIAIEAIAKDAATYSGQVGGAMVRDAAIAYRALIGGQQPGSVLIK